MTPTCDWEAAEAQRATEFRERLRALLNSVSMENGSNTPDFILADYLQSCLNAFDAAVVARERWYGRDPRNMKLARAQSRPSTVLVPTP